MKVAEYLSSGHFRDKLLSRKNLIHFKPLLLCENKTSAKAFIAASRSKMSLLKPEFYQRPTEIVARELLGKRFVCTSGGQKVSGWIVETEAYLAEGDSACHSVRGKTKSNASMFLPGGHAYVYPIHSRWCVNVVCGEPDRGTAVLIRAVQPEQGHQVMKRRRATVDEKALTSGPGKLCEAFEITRKQDGLPLTTRRRIWIDSLDTLPIKSRQIVKTPRIGVTSAEQMLLRFALRNNPFVSGPKKWRT